MSKANLLETDNGNIEYRVVGKGKPILLFHGGHSNCYEKLSHKGFDLNRFRLITPSRIGYGRSKLRSGGDQYKLYLDLINHLKVDKVVVYGISAGGVVAIKFTAINSGRVDKLILASAVSKEWLTPKDIHYIMGYILFNPVVEGCVWGLVKLIGKLNPSLLGRSFFPQFSTLSPKVVLAEEYNELVDQLLLYNSGNGFIKDLRRGLSKDLLEEVNVPTLIIHNRFDSSVSISHGEYSENNIENSTLLIIESRWGHLFWIGEEYREIFKRIETFIGK